MILMINKIVSHRLKALSLTNITLLQKDLSLRATIILIIMPWVQQVPVFAKILLLEYVLSLPFQKDLMSLATEHFLLYP